MIVVAQDWQALKFINKDTKGDRELCIFAVAQNGQLSSTPRRR